MLYLVQQIVLPLLETEPWQLSWQASVSHHQLDDWTLTTVLTGKRESASTEGWTLTTVLTGKFKSASAEDNPDNHLDWQVWVRISWMTEPWQLSWLASVSQHQLDLCNSRIIFIHFTGSYLSLLVSHFFKAQQRNLKSMHDLCSTSTNVNVWVPPQSQSHTL